MKVDKYFSQNNKQNWWKPGKGEGWGEKIGGAFLLKLLPHRHVIFKANKLCDALILIIQVIIIETCFLPIPKKN